MSMKINLRNHFSFEINSKHCKGLPPKTQVKRDVKMSKNDKYLLEKLGRNDLCSCGSSRRFLKYCLPKGKFDGSIHHYALEMKFSEGAFNS